MSETSPVVERFALALTNEIDRRELSAHGAAMELGVSSSALYRYTKGERAPGLDELATMVRAWPQLLRWLPFVLTGKGTKPGKRARRAS